jgi:hypothetical protein
MNAEKDKNAEKRLASMSFILRGKTVENHAGSFSRKNTGKQFVEVFHWHGFVDTNGAAHDASRHGFVERRVYLVFLRQSSSNL